MSFTGDVEAYLHAPLMSIEAAAGGDEKKRVSIVGRVKLVKSTTYCSDLFSKLHWSRFTRKEQKRINFLRSPVVRVVCM